MTQNGKSASVAVVIYCQDEDFSQHKKYNDSLYSNPYRINKQIKKNAQSGSLINLFVRSVLLCQARQSAQQSGCRMENRHPTVQKSTPRGADFSQQKDIKIEKTEPNAPFSFLKSLIDYWSFCGLRRYAKRDQSMPAITNK